MVDIEILLPAHEEDVGVLYVSSCTTDLLIVGNDVGGHLIVYDKGNIALVITHSQFYGGNNGFYLVLTEALLYLMIETFSLFTDTGVIGLS